MKLNSSYDRKIKWIGKDTSGKFTLVAYGDTYKEIWDTTVDHDVNHWDYEFDYVMERLGKTENDYMVDGELDEEKQMNDYYDYKSSMTDEEYKDMLESSQGNAYYTEFEYRNDEGEFE